MKTDDLTVFNYWVVVTGKTDRGYRVGQVEAAGGQKFTSSLTILKPSENENIKEHLIRVQVNDIVER